MAQIEVYTCKLLFQEDEGNDSGSETGSESMFETAPIDQEPDEATDERTLKLPFDNDDYQSDASSDILEPTQVCDRLLFNFLCQKLIEHLPWGFRPGPTQTRPQKMARGLKYRI